MAVNPGSILNGMKWLGMIFRPQRLRDLTILSLDELTEQYRNLDKWGNVIGFATTIGLAVIGFFAGYWLTEYYYADLQKTGFVIGPTFVEIGIYATFIGFFGSFPVVLLLLRLYLGRQEYELYICYVSHKVFGQFDFQKCAVFLIVPLIVLGITLVTLRFDHNTAFTDSEILDNPFWSIGEKKLYRYADIKSIHEVQKYHARYEDKFAPMILVVFKDGTRWQSERQKAGNHLDYQRKI